MPNFMSQPYRIALVAPYGNLTTMFARVAEGLPCTLTVQANVALDEAVSAARTMLTQAPEGQEPEVICSRGGSADFIQAELEVPVVEVSTTSVDLLRTLLPFSGKVHRVAFFKYQTPMPEVQTVGRALRMEIREYLFNNRAEMMSRMVEAAAEGAQMGVGGSLVGSMRELSGIDGVVLEVGEDAVLRALREAFSLARVRRTERQRQARTVTILQTINEGVMVTDENNMLTLINPAAESILGVSAAQALGHDSREKVPNTQTWNVLQTGEPELNKLQDINGKIIVTNRIPIKADGNTIGVVCSFSEAEKIRHAERQLRNNARASHLKTRYGLEDIITADTSMKNLVKLARSYARTDASILLQGESGCGKELFAQGIHRASKRANGPFVPVNCAAIPASLLESELFGYEDGAFTGARRHGKAGYFELAHEGTLFLDEISELPHHLQSRLLRVLQEHEVMRIGGAQMIPVDVRIICASNRSLAVMVRSGQFRQDLYYRCNVLPITVPPLRERGRDILLLACHFLHHNPGGNFKKTLTPASLKESCGERLLGHTWPGNVRELANVMERLALAWQIFPDQTLDTLLERIFISDPGEIQSGILDEALPGGSLREIIRWAEQQAIRREVIACDNDYTKAARRLSISRASLWRKLRAAPTPGEECR